MARRLVLLLALLLVPALAGAHGPTRQKVTESITIAAPPEKVWAVLKNFAEPSWHPKISAATVTKGSEVGSVRTITVGGATMDEELSKIDDAKMRIQVFVGKVNTAILPASNYSATIEVAPDGGGSKVTWRAAFYRGDPNGTPPPQLNDEAAVKGITAWVREGLEGLKAAVASAS